jgi:hypothetical protein
MALRLIYVMFSRLLGCNQKRPQRLPQREGFCLPAPDLDYRRIRRRPVLGGLINEYERAA